MSRRNLGPKLKFLEKRGLYYIVWTEDGRSRERSTGTADSTAAQIELAQFLQRRTSGVRTRDPSEFLVTEALTAYLEHLEAIGKDCERAAYASVPLTDYFAGKSIAEVPSLCVGFQRWRKASNGTVRRDLGVLQSAMKYALEAQLVTRHVVIKLPAAPPPRERWLTRSEAAILIAGALGFQPTVIDIKTRLPVKWKRITRPQYHLALFILLCIYTGRRKEAILSLRWSKVDIVRGKIDFRRDGTAETKKKRGRCALPARLRPHLIRAKGEAPNIGHVIRWEGAAIDEIKTSFNNAVRRVYLKGVTPHTLKHTAATWLMQSGKDPFKISDFLATSVPTLLKHYGHHNPEHQHEIADAIGACPGMQRHFQG
jgi:integrase